ncbi:MAG: HAMP domain-containing histidine kinase [Bacteroidetes bacterium]|nr:HAMP domain-containing histidine kinase [Bacteroidota bacterium]
MTKKDRGAYLSKTVNSIFTSKLSIVIGATILSELIYIIIHFSAGLDGYIGFVLSGTMAATLSYLIGGQLFNINLKLKQAQQDLEQTNEQLIAANQLRTQMLSIVAHDIRSPISSLISYGTLLLDEKAEGTRELEILAKMTQHGESTLRAVDDLLLWAKSAEKPTYNSLHEPVNLNQILEEEIKLLEPIAAQKSIEITLNQNNTILTRNGKNELSFIARNLLNNALKFSETGGHIQIDIAEKNGLIRLKCSDNGVGMEPEQVARIFKSHTNTSHNGTQNEVGFGFGLPMTYEFVKKLGGEIEVQSEPNKGTTFTIELPN